MLTIVLQILLICIIGFIIISTLYSTYKDVKDIMKDDNKDINSKLH
jgi:hypothetical protein